MFWDAIFSSQRQALELRHYTANSFETLTCDTCLLKQCISVSSYSSNDCDLGKLRRRRKGVFGCSVLLNVGIINEYIWLRTLYSDL